MGGKPSTWTGEEDVGGASGCAELTDPARLAALAQSGLGPYADPDMEYLAAWVCRALDVPVALVSLVQRSSRPGVG